MATKPSIPKGTRDFMPEEMAKRNYIFDTIRQVYSLYGFQQIETPAMENLSTLMGKYGEEGDKLLFKILNSGDFLGGLTETDFQERNSVKATSRLSEKGLRYDLTVPFARFVTQYRDQIKMPFKRFQIQPVWRADRPQKGRYREFYQCDADIVGSDSLLNELELVQIIDEVFRRFKIRVAIKINNRKVLAGLAEYIGQPDKITDITVAIDKMDKIGLEQVNAEMAAKGLPQEAIDKLQPVLSLTGDNMQKIISLRQILSCSPTGCKGLDELQELLQSIAACPHTAQVDLDLTLARGLNYYTGTILEVKALDTEMGSITGGGRYDNLTGVFGMEGISGVGISFGADRIYDVLNQLNLYPNLHGSATKVLFAHFDEDDRRYCLPWAAALRAQGVACEIYPDIAKLKKQLQYANDRQIPFVAVVGANERAQKVVQLKDMVSGSQRLCTLEQLKTLF